MQKSSNWQIWKFVFIHFKAVKVSQNDQIRMQTWFTSVFLMNGAELRNFRHFQVLTWIAYSDLSRNLENWSELFFIHCKTVKVSQDDQIENLIYKMNLRSFSHFQILIHFKAVKVSQNDQIRMQTWFTSVFNGAELRNFRHFQVLTWIAYSDSRNLENWRILEFLFIHCETVNVSRNDQIQMQTWFTSVFLINGTELRSFSHFHIDLNYLDLSRNLENWLISELFFIHCKTVKVRRWSNSNLIWFTSVFLMNRTEFLVIFKFWPKSHNRIFAEIF